MSTKNWFRTFASIFLTVLLLGLAKPVNNLAASANPENPSAKIEAKLFNEIAAKGQADFFITFKEKANLGPAKTLTSKAQKGAYVYDTLRLNADAAQHDLRAYLDTRGVQYTSFYITNAILVRGGNQDLLMAVAAQPEVASVTANHSYQMEQPKAQSASQAPNGVEPNLSFVNADDAWALGYTGQGIVLADNSTGLDWTHPAIQPHYRGWNGVTADHNYSWWDATGTYPDEPVDTLGAGSIIAGIMVGDDGGDNQIGMAPGAKTIHCKSVYEDWSATDATFLTCLEWDLAPWDLTGANPRPDLAPDVVNFSRNSEDTADLRDAFDNLIAAGILVAAQVGDTWELGEGCATASSPGNYPEVLGIGSVLTGEGTLPGVFDDGNARGPSVIDGGYEPDILAPGQNIRSSYPGGNYQYAGGTGYATPHATGLVGLMWSANPALRGQVEATLQIIKDSAVPLTGQTGSSCGGDYTTGPNNDWGYGTIDALAAVQAAIAYGGTAGTLQGTVTDAVSHNPIARASILATLTPTQTFQIFTDQSGIYSLEVISGTYTVDAQAFGYQPAQAADVEVEDGETITQSFQLVPLPTHVVSVTVVDANTGWPLYALASLPATPLDPAWNDPVTGRLEFSVPEGLATTLVIDAWTPGYLRKQVAVGPVTDDMALVVQVEPDLGACNAPGYEFVVSSTVLTQDFELSDGGYIVTGTNSSWEWGAPIYGPGAAHSGSNVWATGLSGGSYLDGGEAYLISPPIDLSSFTGSSFNVGWWQWLQTEESFDFADLQVSKDGGMTWSTVYGPYSGNVDLSWANRTVVTDPSYAVSNFQLRFHLQSDVGGDPAGWYVDDVGISAGECLPMAGGLVVGNVYDANTNQPLVGASVENASSFSTLTASTPDTTVDDAFYVLFSPGDLHDFTAQMGNYAPEVEAVQVISGSVVMQDFSLKAGLLAADPLNLEATVELGDSATLPLTLTNAGGAQASFTLAEMNSGFQPMLAEDAARTITIPAAPAELPAGVAIPSDYKYKPHPELSIDIPAAPPAGPEVFIACADSNACEPIASMLMAFGDIRSVTRFDARYGTPSLEQLSNYDVVLSWGNYPYYDAVAMGNVLADYVDAGGKVINLQFDLWGALQGRFMDENYTAMTAGYVPYQWVCLGTFDASHPIMAGVTELCDAFSAVGIDLTPGSSAVAHWSNGEPLVAVKDNRSVASINLYVGFYYAWSGQADVLVHNAILWLAEDDLPWLSEAPITGTLQAETGLQDLAVTFDAGVPEISQPGEYSAWLKVRSDTPYTPLYLPVKMTVTPPDTYGKLEGTVQSLGHCDEVTATLEGARILIESGAGMAWEVKTDTSGHYHVWGDATVGPLTVTVSAQDHLQAVLAGVILTGGQTTTHDFDLRSIQSCVSLTPAVLDVNVPLGYAKTLGLEVLNDGAGASPLVIKEVAGTGFTGNPDPPVYGLVGVFQDAYPFWSTIVTETLAANGIPYEVHNSTEFGSLDFSRFKMILIPTDQTQSMIDAYAVYTAKFESYVAAGGFLAFFATEPGSNGGILNVPLPGGMIYVWNKDGESFNDVDDPTHPVMAGVPNPFQGDWASAGYFTNLPTGAKVIASSHDLGNPTIVEYPLGEGLVLALTMPVEAEWYFMPDLYQIMINTYRWGANYVPAPHAAWLVEDILTGTLEADSSLSVELTLSTLPTMKVGDVYTATLWVMSKDATQSRIPVTVRIHVVKPTIYLPVLWKRYP